VSGAGKERGLVFHGDGTSFWSDKCSRIRGDGSTTLFKKKEKTTELYTFK
jgi:hypothetical protein